MSWLRQGKAGRRNWQPLFVNRFGAAVFPKSFQIWAGKATTPKRSGRR